MIISSLRQDLVPGAKVTAIDCDLMDFESVRAAAAAIATVKPTRPGVELRANLESISHTRHLFEVAFE